MLRHNQQAQEALQKPATAEEESPPAAPTPAAEDIRLFLQHEQGRLTFKVKLTTKARLPVLPRFLAVAATTVFGFVKDTS